MTQQVRFPPTCNTALQHVDSALVDRTDSCSPLSVTSSASPISQVSQSPPIRTQQADDAWRTFCLNVQGDQQFTPPDPHSRLEIRDVVDKTILQTLLEKIATSASFLHQMQAISLIDDCSELNFQSNFPCFFSPEAKKLYSRVKTHAGTLCLYDSQTMAFDTSVAYKLQMSSFGDKATAFYFSELFFFVFAKFYGDSDTFSDQSFIPACKMLLQDIVLSCCVEILDDKKLPHAHFDTMNTIAIRLRYRETILPLISGIKTLDIEKRNHLQEGMQRYEELRSQITPEIIKTWPEPAQKLYTFLGSVDQQDVRSILRSMVIQALST